MKIPASCKQIYARVFRSVLLQHCLSRGVFTSEFGRIGSPALAAMGGGAEAVPPFFCSESSGGRRGPGPGCVHAPVQQQSCKSHHRSWRTSRRVCGSSDTASHLSPPPSPPPSRLDICVASDRIPSLFGVQTSTDHGSIPWGTYNLSHDVCLPLALQGPSAHALAPSFCLACGRGVMPQDAGVVARAGFPSAARRCVAWWGCGGDDFVNVILVVACQNNPDHGYIGGDGASNKLHDGCLWVSLKPNRRCLASGVGRLGKRGYRLRGKV